MEPIGVMAEWKSTTMTNGTECAPVRGRQRSLKLCAERPTAAALSLRLKPHILERPCCLVKSTPYASEMRAPSRSANIRNSRRTVSMPPSSVQVSHPSVETTAECVCRTFGKQNTPLAFWLFFLSPP